MAEQLNSPKAYDRVFLNSRRETITLLIAFTIFLFWSVGASYKMGYGLSPEETAQTVMGIPRWVFWGVGLPWMAANVFTIWFAWGFMANDPLGTASDEVSETMDVNAGEGNRTSEERS